MLKVGITGGIGSGKTTVCKLFATLDIPVYYADERAKEIMVSDSKIIAEIKTLFGNEAYSNHDLNRKFIAQAVFNNNSLLKQLNAIVHPAVFQDSQHWFQQHQHTTYILYEAAIMFESGSHKLMDKMITVVAPMEDRISRTMQRDRVSREDVLARIEKQLPDEEKIKKSDYIIYNDGSRPLLEQVIEIHQQLISIP